MYQPTVARWSSMDPIRIVAELNWFTYTTSSPTYRVDLSGLFSISTDNLESLGCNHLNEHELRDLETCGPTNGKCGCTVWNVGPTTNLTQQTIQDPFLDPRNIAQPVCSGGKLTVQINPNRNQKLEEPPFNIPNPLGLLEFYNSLGVGKCLYAHEMHHIAQYNCVCPDLCAKQDGPITISASCLGTAECWAYAGQSNCMIKAACAAFHRGKLDGPRPDPSQLQLFETIMKLIDSWGQHAQDTYCRQYANIVELTKNGQNWKELVARRPCRPSFGI